MTDLTSILAAVAKVEAELTGHWSDHPTHWVVARNFAIYRVFPAHESSDGEKWIDECRVLELAGSDTEQLPREYRLPRSNLKLAIRHRNELISALINGELCACGQAVGGLGSADGQCESCWIRDAIGPGETLSQT